MSALPQANSQSELDRLDAATDQAIQVCGGDLRHTIRSLILANEFLEARNVELASNLSVGYMRGQIPANNRLEDSLSRELDE